VHLRSVLQIAPITSMNDLGISELRLSLHAIRGSGPKPEIFRLVTKARRACTACARLFDAAKRL
jgi:hypothetical protein